jgi:lipopolysaccharide export system protein LptA
MARAKQTTRRAWPLLALGTGALLLLTFAQAFAQAPVSGFSGLGGANAKKPIDIESDRLEVDDKSHKAIFIGSVSATQGDYNLKAPRLEVIYESGSQASPADKAASASKPVKPVKAPAASAAGDPVSSGQIKTIHALGGTVVIVNKKEQQEATGDEAIYDVKAQKVTLTGKQVILRQKQEAVVEGKRLEINLATSQANLIPDDEPSKGGEPAQKTRVRAIFQQEAGKGSASINPFGQPSKKEKKEETPPQKPAAPSPGWQTQSR